MHTHDHDHLETDGSTAPGRSRTELPDATVLRAAAEGRTDVLGAGGLLGVQRVAGNEAAAGLVEEERSPVLDVVSGGGQQLDGPVRQDMEARMGHDFGDVRIHTDPAADHSARAVDAHAYTVGSDIVFQRGSYDPASTGGRTLLAHELTHVVQQRHGAVDGTPTGDGISVSDPSDRFEREAASNAERVMAAPAPVQAAPATGPASAGASVQREAAPEEDEEPMQMSAVQRQHDGEEEELSM